MDTHGLLKLTFWLTIVETVDREIIHLLISQCYRILLKKSLDTESALIDPLKFPKNLSASFLSYPAG